ncbi:ATP-binding cassette domain-containing protein [Bdellovibrio reynosensis]|uniref:ATP-binding cassette domain-containing protein n=1 Tax=Bdellovibrio reynosensis TaxID=2835041 RepID=A0ABY4C751_9BACT|nr:ATP-binding cassette domain-containing protein [Bdellovibrio reynosensis]UOF00634.1 ATP-binding cassette domain-containing protein [Bdellovibrio reynosensis]
MQSLVTASGLTFEYANGHTIFKNLNFSITSKTSALVGPNGVGKTTLAKLLVGELEVTSGSIIKRSSVTFFPQRLTPEAFSVDEFLALDYEWSKLGEKLLEGIDRSNLCTTLSGGEWMRVRLAKTLNDDFLILDEPSNDLDREGRKVLIEFLNARSGGVLIISHDRELLAICEEILELSNQGLAKYGGDFSEYEHTKGHERDNLAQQLSTAKNQRQKAKAERHEQILRQEKRNQRGAEQAARGGIPKILLGARKRKAEATTGKVDTLSFERSNSAVTAAFEAYSEMKIDPVMYADLMGQELPAQKLIAETSGFNIRFKDWLYGEDLNFSWRGNIRLALKGLNGSGKSTLLKAIMGQKFETKGQLRVGDVSTLYVDQQCRILDDTKTVLENVADSSLLTESEIRNGLAKFLFAKDAVFQKVSSLSGGERLRAALAKGILSNKKPELLILDEPTNNLDLVNIQFLESLVKEFKAAVLAISHDEIFLQNSGITEEFKIHREKFPGIPDDPH